MTLALEQIKALEKVAAELREPRTMSQFMGSHDMALALVEERALTADRIDTALQSLRDEAGAAVDFGRAAILLDRYAEVIREAPVKDIERYDYLPEVEDMAESLRSLTRPAPAAPVSDAAGEAVTAWVGEMQTSAGTDYYVCVGRRTGDPLDRTYRTPQKYRIRGHAEYDVACWNHMLHGGAEPDPLAFDTDIPVMDTPRPAPAAEAAPQGGVSPEVFRTLYRDMQAACENSDGDPFVMVDAVRLTGWVLALGKLAGQAATPPSAPAVRDAEAMGAAGGPASESERLAFEAWMRGHCWALSATWNGTEYRSDAEQGGRYCPQAATTRMLWAAWRDRAALSDPVPQEGVDEAVNRFLGWPLPKDFAPDCGITFDGRHDDEWNKGKTWPTGTNLFTAEQAKAMFEHCLAAGALPQGMVLVPREPTEAMLAAVDAISLRHAAAVHSSSIPAEEMWAAMLAAAPAQGAR